jgi:hypothetical protein
MTIETWVAVGACDLCGLLRYNDGREDHSSLCSEFRALCARVEKLEAQREDDRATPQAPQPDQAGRALAGAAAGGAVGAVVGAVIGGITGVATGPAAPQNTLRERAEKPEVFRGAALTACIHPPGSRTCEICTLPDDDETSAQAIAARALKTREYST